MYGTEPRYNDLRYNDISNITMRIQRTEGKIFPDITVRFRRQIFTMIYENDTVFQPLYPLYFPCHSIVLLVSVSLTPFTPI